MYKHLYFYLIYNKCISKYVVLLSVEISSIPYIQKLHFRFGLNILYKFCISLQWNWAGTPELTSPS